MSTSLLFISLSKSDDIFSFIFLILSLVYQRLFDVSESDDDINSVLSEADLASIISDSDYQLETIVSAMNDDERAVLRDDVVKIQKNVKRWLMQKNFENIRQAALKVASRRRTTLTRREFVQKKKAATALQAAARGLRDRREFQQIRQRASATLVINRHVREWMRRKKSIHLETVMVKPEKSAPPTPAVTIS